MNLNIKEEIAKSRNVALYANLDGSWAYVSEVDYIDYDEHYQTLPEGQRRERQKRDMVRVSEPIEVRLVAVSDDTAIENAIKSLDEAERAAIAELNDKIAKIRGQKAQLLSLTHQTES